MIVIIYYLIWVYELFIFKVSYLLFDDCAGGLSKGADKKTESQEHLCNKEN